MLVSNEPIAKIYDFGNDHSFYEKLGGYDTLFVLFNYWGQPISARSHYRFLEGIACNRLFLHSGASDWFQHGIPGVAESFEQLLEFAKTIREHFVERRILFVGHSMGAYAALACGIASGADRILVSVPEIELCLPGSLSQKYIDKTQLLYPSIVPHLTHNRVKIDCIVGYEDVYDREVAKQMSEYNNINIHMLACGHETFPYLRDKGVLSKLFQVFAEGGELKAVLGPFYHVEKI